VPIDFVGGSGGTGPVPIDFVGGSGGTGPVPIDCVGGNGGTGPVPIAISVDPCPPEGAVPAIVRRSDKAVATTSKARRNVKTRFFI